MGIITGLIIGAIIYLTYQYRSGNQYYEDSYDFDVPEIKAVADKNAEIVFHSAEQLKTEESPSPIKQSVNPEGMLEEIK